MAASPPYSAPIADSQQYCSAVWLKWFTALLRTLNIAPLLIGSVSRSGLVASVAATSIATATLTAGLYRITVYARPTVPATTSSSILPFVVAVESGVTVTQVPPYALTSNAVASPGSWVFLQRIDVGTPIKYGVTYASVGATALTYRLDVVVEAVPS